MTVLIRHLTSPNEKQFKKLIIPHLLVALRNFVDSLDKYAPANIKSKKKSKYAIWLYDVCKRLIFEEHASSIIKQRTDPVTEDEVEMRYCSCRQVPHAKNCHVFDIDIGIALKIENSRIHKFSQMCAATGVNTVILENS